MKKIITIFVLIAFLALVYPSSAADNCIVCHNTYDFGEFTSINKSLFGVHVNINSTDGSGMLTTYDCVECHYNVSNMYTPGFTVATYTCEDCHVRNITGIVPANLMVSNHIPNGSTNISLTGASCVDCHNKTANLYRYSYNASAAHYGRNASFGISPGAAYCAYCHANSSTIYKDVMENQNNINLGNHTSGRFSRHIANPGSLDGGPDCTTCHNTGRMHDANLTKPVLNSKLCNACHQMDTIKKDLHAGKIECAQCHTEVNSDIHNIKYLLQDGTYRSANATGCPDCHGTPWIPIKLPFPTANCTTCHLGSGLANLTQFADAPLLPSPITHLSLIHI